MPPQPATLESDNPGAQVYEGLSRCILAHPDDEQLQSIKAALDANPAGLPYNTLLGLFCLAGARCSELSAIDSSGTLSVGENLIVAGEAGVDGDLNIGGDSQLTGDLEVIGDTTLAVTEIGGAVSAPGMASGTYVAGRPVVYRHPTTHALYSAVPAPETPTNTGVRYLSARGDGLAGTGTKNDPFDASTAAKIQALWPTLPTNVDIEFVSGYTYLLNAYHYWAASDGYVCLPIQGTQNIKFTGATLKLANGQMTGENKRVDFIAKIDSEGSAGHVVQGGTIDGNRDNQASWTDHEDYCEQYAVNIGGAGSWVDGVKLVNSFNSNIAGVSAGDEGFPFSIFSGLGTFENPTVVKGFTDCEVVDHKGFITAFNLLGGYGATRTATGIDSTDIITCASGAAPANGATIKILSKTGGDGVVLRKRYIVRNRTAGIPGTFQISEEPESDIVDLGSDLDTCTFIEQTWITGSFLRCKASCDVAGSFSNTQVFGAAGWLNVSVVDCQGLDVFGGVYTDTGAYENVLVDNCYFRLNASNPGLQAARGVSALSGHGSKGWTIRRCIFDLCSNSVGVSLSYMDAGAVSQCTFRYGPSGGTQVAIGMVVGTNSGVRVEQNMQDSGVTNVVPSLGAILVWASGNRKTDGTIADIPESLNSAEGLPAFALRTRIARYDGGSAGAQAIPDTTRANFDFTTQRFDAGSIGNASTNRFTAPSAGFVRMRLAVAFTAVGGSGLVQLEWLKNGASNVLPHKLLTPAVIATTYELEFIDACAANDYYEPSIYNNAGGSTSVDRNYQASWVEFEFTPDA